MANVTDEELALMIKDAADIVNSYFHEAEKRKMKVIVKQDANIDFIGEVIPFNVPIKLFIRKEYL